VIPVAEARQHIIDAIARLPAEVVPVTEAAGRVLAEDLAARVTQPPADMSAMDGYAARAEDVATVPARLRLAGHAPAGGAHEGQLKPGEAVRIFTGGPVPAGADTIVIQENTTPEGETVLVNETVTVGRHIRRAGLDFRAGEVELTAGTRLSVRDIGLAAAMNIPWVKVVRRPRVAILATGDEIVFPGEARGPHQIVSSNSIALGGLVAAAGGEAINLGIARDNEDSLRRMAAGAQGADMLVTTGGVSVGDHDLVKSVLGAEGLAVGFWKIAMRPGKPLLFGKMGATPMLGLPGNPVSTAVCGLVFLLPALRALAGEIDFGPHPEPARLGVDLRPNDNREDYLRASLAIAADGQRTVVPFERQDSSMLSVLSRSNCLLVRQPFAEATAAGSIVDIIRFPSGPIPV